MDNEEKLLISRTEDKIRLCLKYASSQFMHFLNEAEMQIVSEYVKSKNDALCMLFGGYDDARRCILGVFPEWEEPACEAFPIAALEIKKGYNISLTHRDYLGAVLSLGIERTKVGDILTKDDGAYVFVMEDIADFVIGNLKKIANCGVCVKRAENVCDLPKPEYEHISAVAASERLDALVAAALNISRNQATLLINSGRVMVNHKEVLKTSFVLKKGDLMSIRGAGRIELEEIGNNTRSGRLHVLFKKYVK